MTPETEKADDDSLVDLRCSVVVAHGASVLLIRRHPRRSLGGDGEDWVLPGGRPRDGEGLASCARREVAEETGLRVDPQRCAFVAEVISPRGRRTIEVIFLVRLTGAEPPTPTGEAGTQPVWIPLGDIRGLEIRPPIAGFLPAVLHPRGDTAAYLGNLWRGPIGAP